MSIGGAVSNLVQSILDIIAGIFNSLLALLQGAGSLVGGVLHTAFSIVEGFLGIIWNNIGVLLLLGLSLCAYQIFVVDKGVGARNSRKKVA